MSAPDMHPLIEQYMPLAQSLAQQVWRTAPHALELDELRGIAYLGLVGAANRWAGYCAERGYSPHALQYFRPFVVRRVRGSLIDAIRSSDWATRNLRTRAKALQEAGQDQGVAEATLAARTGMSITDVRATIRGMAQRPVSLDGEDLEPGATDNVEAAAFTHTVLDALVAAIDNLPADQQVVLALHYFTGMQLQEVAKTMQVSESRASQLHAQAVLSVHTVMAAAATGQQP